MMTTTKGWLADPLGRFDERWWDGTQWTASVALDGAQFVDYEPLNAPAGPRQGPPRASIPSEVFAIIADECDAQPSVVFFRRKKQSFVDLYPSWSVHRGDGTWLGGIRFVVETAPEKANNRQSRFYNADGQRHMTVERIQGATAVRIIASDGSTIAESGRYPSMKVRCADGREASMSWRGIDHLTISDDQGPLALISTVGGRKLRKVEREHGWDPSTVIIPSRTLDAGWDAALFGTAMGIHPFLSEMIQSS